MHGHKSIYPVRSRSDVSNSSDIPVSSMPCRSSMSADRDSRLLLLHRKCPNPLMCVRRSTPTVPLIGCSPILCQPLTVKPRLRPVTSLSQPAQFEIVGNGVPSNSCITPSPARISAKQNRLRRKVYNGNSYSANRESRDIQTDSQVSLEEKHPVMDIYIPTASSSVLTRLPSGSRKLRDAVAHDVMGIQQNAYYIDVLQQEGRLKIEHVENPRPLPPRRDFADDSDDCYEILTSQQDHLHSQPESLYGRRCVTDSELCPSRQLVRDLPSNTSRSCSYEQPPHPSPPAVTDSSYRVHSGDSERTFYRVSARLKHNQNTTGNNRTVYGDDVTLRRCISGQHAPNIVEKRRRQQILTLKKAISDVGKQVSLNDGHLNREINNDNSQPLTHHGSSDSFSIRDNTEVNYDDFESFEQDEIIHSDDDSEANEDPSELDGIDREMSGLTLDADVLHGSHIGLSSSSSSCSSLRSQSSSFTGTQRALMPSLFSHVTPTINFILEGQKLERLPRKYRQLLRWRMSQLTPIVVKLCIARVGFRTTAKSHTWLGYWGAHMKTEEFRTLKDYQKFNHFPGSFQLGRKDRLWRNLSKLLGQFGKKEFGFFPQTFVLPADLASLKSTWDEGNTKKKWIVKPPASARGIGICVINKWKDIPKQRPIIVQQYISRPFLINRSKFDLRLYVHVTSFDPLRIYIYDDGLVRFASSKYSYSTKNLGNRYMHLTNYSINKQNEGYQSNTSGHEREGHKWLLKTLWDHLENQGICTKTIWNRITDLVIKTVLSAEGNINSMIVGNVRRRYCCHELFGFDVLLDEALKPWLIEVNVSPSLHSNSAVDINVKSRLVKDILNLAGIMLPNREDVIAGPQPPTDWTTYRPSDDQCMDRRLWLTQKSVDERAKHLYYCQQHQNPEKLSTILDVLTPDDIRVLIESVDEYHRRGNFQRIFPSSQSDKYLMFCEQPRYYNLLLDAWVRRYPGSDPQGTALLESYCQEQLHLQNPTSDPSHQWSCPVDNVIAKCSSAGTRTVLSAAADTKRQRTTQN